MPTKPPAPRKHSGAPTKKATRHSARLLTIPRSRSHHHKRQWICASPKRLGSASCEAQVIADASSDAAVAATTPYGYGPSDLQSAYSLTSLSTSRGSGQVVGIVDAYDDPTAESDLAAYRSQYGLPACTTAGGCFRKVNQRGGTTYPAPNSSWAGEISLDLDMVSAVCPNCQIVLVETDDNGFGNLAAGVNEAAALGATQISNSYGGGEWSSEASLDSYYTHAGVAVTASSGDNGYGVSYPAASKAVTAVGGTSLSHAANSRGWSESAWSGAGSGCSLYESKPSWQTDSGCPNRTVADVSAVADPNTGVAVYNGGWLVYGGTSASAPIVAGFDALVGASAASAQYFYSTQLNDVTSGANGSCSPSYLCVGSVGFDGPTGMGTLKGVITPGAPGASTGSATSVASTGTTVNGNVNPDGLATTYHFDWGTTASYGNSSSDQTAGSDYASHAFSASLTSLSAGTTYHYRLVATNSSGTTYGSDQTFTTTVPSAPQGSWSGTYGSTGYDLLGWNGSSDQASLPSGVTATVAQGTRYTWASSTSDGRALKGPGGSAARAAGLYDSGQIRVKLDFAAAYSGNIELYALDWDNGGRRETVTVGSGTTSIAYAFNMGAWVTAPVTVSAGGSVTITVARTAGSNAVLSGIFLDGTYTPPSGGGSSGPQGSWVGTYGAQGYALAAWNGSTDQVSLPSGVNLSLVSGSRYQWAGSTSDTRALQSADQSTRRAAGWYDSNQVQLKLDFAGDYSGNIELYALDWDNAGRRETITADGQTTTLSSAFNQGDWVTVPVTVSAGGSVTITVARTAGNNAVLSGVFLDGTYTPPSGGGGGGGGGTVASAPQGSWSGTYGVDGYVLGAWNGSSDLTALPSGVSAALVRGTRYAWAASTSDVRALQSPDKTTREAAGWYDSSQVQVKLSFTNAYSGNLHLYAVDWDASVRRETITVNGQATSLSSSFNQGAWVTLPITVSAGGTLTITVDNTAGTSNAVLSGIFLGDAGTPPTPPYTNAPQGNWVGAHGTNGYDLFAFNAGSDVSSMPGVTATVQQGTRYVFAAGTTSVRALQNAAKTSRTAAALYDPSEVRVQLTFTSAYSGNLELYAVDWDANVRREKFTVGTTVVDVPGAFDQGVWVNVPISVSAGGSVVIKVDTKTSQGNAVLSGLFLD